MSFKRFRDKAQRVIREAKQTSWKAGFSSLSRSTRSDVVRDRLQLKSGKYSRTIVTVSSAGGVVLTAQADITNAIAFSLSTVCSLDNYDPDLRAVKNNAKTVPLKFTCAAEDYNAIFTMGEPRAASDRCHITSPGPGGIHNEMLSHLPLACKDFLLSIYNHRWTSLVPDAWKEAIVIPVLKPSRDRSRQLVTDRSASLVACVRQWSAW
jgi:hypothetical protein